MFTGIIEEMGSVEVLTRTSLSITAAKVLEGTKLGDSIAVNGVCLTVTKLGEHSFVVEVMPETLGRSNLGGLARGDRVNLERALAMGNRLGGHLVQGHIDDRGRVVSMTPQGNAVLLKLSAPAGISRYLVEKAFVAVDGASLTVVACDGPTFTVSIVGYTLHNTTVGIKKPGQAVNLEVDIVAKYVEHFVRAKGSGITMDVLAQSGFCSSGLS
ncbi:MAG: riboflavin synthase [Dehalococcoidia bacterium]|nr:riboflavin synthase [Dehalococcoidia bacterium]